MSEFSLKIMQLQPSFGFGIQCSLLLFMPPYRKIGAYCSTSVRPSVCKLNMKTFFFPLLLNLFSYKAHIWYEGTSHRYTSPGTKVKVICKGQGQISESCFSKDGCFGGISVSQTHLAFFFFFVTMDSIF